MLNIEKYKDEILCIGEYETYMNANGIDYKQGCYKEEVFEWLCSEYKESLLTKDEKEYLYRIQEALDIEIDAVCKRISGWTKEEGEFIAIAFHTKIEKNCLSLPVFKKNGKFKNLELGEEYTAKELELQC